MFNYEIPLNQSESHNGYERYALTPVNDGIDAIRFEYIRDFNGTANAAQLAQRDALRAALLLALNDAGVMAGLSSIASDVTVTDSDSFVALISTKLNA